MTTTDQALTRVETEGAARTHDHWEGAAVVEGVTVKDEEAEASHDGIGFDIMGMSFGWPAMLALVVLIPLLYVSPFLVNTYTAASDVLCHISFGIPIITSFMVALLLGWTGLLIASAAHVIALQIMAGQSEWMEPTVALTMIGIIIATQVSAVIITLLVQQLRRQMADVQDVNDLLREMALVDEMTGIYNYRYFMNRLDRELLSAERYGRPMALLLVDIDHFKSYNDMNGHLAGDEALRRLSALFEESIRPSDTVARYGGEEFVIIVPDTDAEAALAQAERLCGIVAREPFTWGDRKTAGALTVSIGVSVYPSMALDKDTLLRQADDSLYYAKQMSGDRAELYNEAVIGVDEEVREDTAVLASIRTLLGVISARDGYTYDHSRRVMKYSVVIAERMGLKMDDLRTLQWAALVHDLGKIELSAEILNKPRCLEDHEWDAIRRHPDTSAQIIEPIIERMYSITETVRAHHERYDGKGYPRGMVGEEIPISARVLAVADAIDAMYSDRPYRERLAVEEITEELRGGRFQQFDPDVVDVAVEALEAGDID